MVDIFFLIILAFIIGLFGGLLYLVYLPFKKRLKISGKLTDKLNRQINWTFILLLFSGSVVIYCFKDCRTPSKERLEKISDIKLPTDFNVIKDEYQDMWQDYCILYDIQFGNIATTELVKNIKTSKFYNAKVIHKGPWTENAFITIDSAKAVWCKSLKGFDFSRQDGLTSYYIELDTLTNILKYIEYAH